MFVFSTAHDVFTNNTKFSGISQELEELDGMQKRLLLFCEGCLPCSVQQAVGYM